MLASVHSEHVSKDQARRNDTMLCICVCVPIFRRVLTMEWVTGVKLTTLPPDEIRDLVGVGQEAFLVQLLEVGFFHGDPHPGNLLKVRPQSWQL